MLTRYFILIYFTARICNSSRTHSPLEVHSPQPPSPCSGTILPFSPLLSAGGARRTPHPSCRGKLDPSPAGSAGPPGTGSRPKRARRWSAEESGSAEGGEGAGGAAGPPDTPPRCTPPGWSPGMKTDRKVNEVIRSDELERQWQRMKMWESCS